MTTEHSERSVYTLDEAADYLGCSRWTLRDQVTRGEVPHHRRGRVKGVYFTPENLEEIVVSQGRGVRRTPASRASKASAVATSVMPVPEEFARLRRQA